MEKTSKDLIGHTFGNLFVVGKIAPKGEHGKSQWHCLCTCGGHRVVSTRPLVNGTTTGCMHHNKKVQAVRSLKDAQSIATLRSHPHLMGLIEGLKIEDKIAQRMIAFIQPWSVGFEDLPGFGNTIIVNCNWIGSEQDEVYGYTALQRIHQALDKHREQVSGDRHVRISCPIRTNAFPDVPDSEFRADVLGCIDKLNQNVTSLAMHLEHIQQKVTSDG